MDSYGIIGHPVGHSLSPWLHRELYRQTGCQATYSHFEVLPEQVKDVVPALKTLGIRGVNVTSPHKQAVIPFVDRISSEGEAIGAVNTLLVEDGVVSGHNTDCHGFARSLLHSGIEIRGKRFVLCGMSGAGKAVQHGLLQEGAAEITVVSTREGVGISYEQLRELPHKDVIINCTPLGMHPREDQSPVNREILGKFSAAVDLIYNPEETLFLKMAREQGLPALNGLWMLIFQGIRSFSIWTGISEDQINADAIYPVLMKRLKG